MSIEPPRDLRQRLEVLPQSYLAARRVTETLRLATNTTRGKREIEQAKNAESGGALSRTSAPDRRLGC
ncbi:hypothetical protein NKG05_11010 [Oerskovia sp. M15]